MSRFLSSFLLIDSTRTYPTSSTAQKATIAEVTLKIPLEATDHSAVTKITGQAITTNESTAYVLKSSRSPYSKKLRAAVAFVPRLSHFDIENERSSTNEFRVGPHFLVPSRIDHSQNRGFSHFFGFRYLSGLFAHTFEA